MDVKRMIELDASGQLNHIKRKGLKGITNRGTFNNAYETCEFYKATAIKGVDFNMMTGDTPKPKHCYW